MVIDRLPFLKPLLSCLGGLLLAVAMACGGGGGGGTSTPPASITSVSVSPTTASLSTGATQQFTASVTGTGSYSSAVTWSASGGTVSSSGLYTAPGTAGTYTVTATSQQDGTKAAGATVAVTVPATITGVTVSPTAASLTTGATQQFTASVTGTGSYSSAVTWSASGGTVSSSGLYTAPGTAGTYTVTATSQQDATKAAAATVTVTVPTQAPSFTTQPQSQTVAAGASVMFTAAATGTPTPTYQWERSADGTTWTAISGATSATYSFTTQASDTGTQFRVKATNSVSTATSSAAKLTVTSTQAPSFTTQPQSQTVAAGASVTFTAAATGSPTPTYQWEQSTGGATWNPLIGATGDSCTLQTGEADNGLGIRVKALNSVAGATSNTALLNVQFLPGISTQPLDQKVASGTHASFLVVARGNPIPSYQWQRSSDGTNWSDISGATAATYELVTQTIDNHTQFRVRVINALGPATSVAASLTVEPLPAKPVFSQHPQPKTVTAGSAVTFKVLVSGYPEPTLQWERSTDGNTWSKVSGADATAYSFLAQYADNKSQLRVKATNSSEEITSDAATISVNSGSYLSVPLRSELVEISSSVPGELTASWMPATDDPTIADSIAYELHLSTPEGDFTPSELTLRTRVNGKNYGTVTGLLSGVRYSARLVVEYLPGGQRQESSSHSVLVSPVVATSKNTSSFVLTNEQIISADLLSGDIKLVSGSSVPAAGTLLVKQNAPGFLRKVLSSTRATDGSVEVTTESGSLSDLFSSISIYSSAKLASVPDVAASLGGVRALMAQQAGGGARMEWPGFILSSSDVAPPLRSILPPSSTPRVSGTLNTAAADGTGTSDLFIVSSETTVKEYDGGLFSSLKGYISAPKWIRILEGQGPTSENKVQICLTVEGGKDELCHFKIDEGSALASFSDDKNGILYIKSAGSSLGKHPVKVVAWIEKIGDNCTGSSNWNKAEIEIDVIVTSSDENFNTRDKALTFSGEFSVNNSVTFQFDPKIEMNIQLDGLSIKEGSIALDATASVIQELTIDASVGAELNKQTKNLINKDFVKIFMAGEVPIIIDGNFQLDVELEGETTGAIHATETATIGFEKIIFGVKYNQSSGQWEPFQSVQPRYRLKLYGQADAEANVEVALVPKLRISVYGVPTARLTLRPALTATAGIHGEVLYNRDASGVTADADYWITKGGLYGKITAYVYVGLEAFHKNLLSYPWNANPEDYTTHQPVPIIDSTAIIQIPSFSAEILKGVHPQNAQAIQIRATALDTVNPFRSWFGPESFLPFNAWSTPVVIAANGTGYRWLSPPSGSGEINTGLTHTKDYWLVLDQPGTYKVRLGGYSAMGSWARQVANDITITSAESAVTNAPPYLSLQSVSGASIAAGQSFTLSFLATDLDKNLANVDLNWNDGSPIVHKIVTNSGGTALFTKSFSTPQTVNWSAVAYDDKGAGSPTVKGSFAVTQVLLPPDGLQYSQNPATYPVGSAITPNKPTIGGGSPSLFTVSPLLPSGLQLDPTTGLISGTPTASVQQVTYVVTASNSAGSTLCRLLITISSGSAIIVNIQPKDPTLLVGKTQAFTATVNGTVNQGVKWSLLDTGGGTLSGTGAYTAPATAGIYRIRAASVLDTTKYSDTNVTVVLQESAPIFTQQPQSQTIVTGKSVAFTVSASGTPTPSFQWERSDNNGTSWTSITGATSSSYSLVTKAADDKAMFRAKAINSLSSSTSNSAILSLTTALTTPKLTSIQPNSIPLGTGSQLVTVNGSEFTSSSWHQLSVDGCTTWYDATSAPIYASTTRMDVYIHNTVAQTIWVRVCAAQGSALRSSSLPVVVSSVASPQVSVTPATGAAGVTTFSEPGTGFTPNGLVTLHFKYPDLIERPTITKSANAGGTYAQTWLPPSDALLGVYSYWAVDNTTGKQSNTATFTLTRLVAPTISSVAPASYVASSTNQPMSVMGSNFQSGATLTFTDPSLQSIPSTAAKLTFVSSSRIDYQFNSGSVAGTWGVKVTNADGQSSAKASFAVTSVTPVISLSTSSISNAGGNVVEAGTGFTPGGSVTAHIRNPNGVDFPTTHTADGTGVYVKNHTVTSAWPSGTHQAWAVDSATGKSSPTVNLMVTSVVQPQVSVTPSSGTAGVTTFSEPGSGFTPNSGVTLHFRYPDGSEPAPVSKTADANGAFSLSWMPSSSALPGVYSYWGVDNSTGKTSNTATFTVIAGVVTPVLNSISPNTITQGTSSKLVTLNGTGFTASSYHQLSTNGGSSWTDAATPPTYLSSTQLSVYISNIVIQTIHVRVCASRGSSVSSGSQTVTVTK